MAEGFHADRAWRLQPALGGELERGVKQASGSFLKKRTKKLSFVGPNLSGMAQPRRVKVFCFFSSEKKTFLA
jgi:hypothetical protein